MNSSNRQSEVEDAGVGGGVGGMRAGRTYEGENECECGVRSGEE
jgi:hypothetical protein